jgi:exonuclease I
MKTISQIINESNEFNLSFNSHKKVYNSFIKWYDKHIGKSMNKDEMVDMLKTIISEIEDDSLDFAK